MIYHCIHFACISCYWIRVSLDEHYKLFSFSNLTRCGRAVPRGWGGGGGQGGQLPPMIFFFFFACQLSGQSCSWWYPYSIIIILGGGEFFWSQIFFFWNPPPPPPQANTLAPPLIVFSQLLRHQPPHCLNKTSLLCVWLNTQPIIMWQRTFTLHFANCQLTHYGCIVLGLPESELLHHVLNFWIKVTHLHILCLMKREGIKFNMYNSLLGLHLTEQMAQTFRSSIVVTYTVDYFVIVPPIHLVCTLFRHCLTLTFTNSFVVSLIKYFYFRCA